MVHLQAGNVHVVHQPSWGMYVDLHQIILVKILFRQQEAVHAAGRGGCVTTRACVWYVSGSGPLSSAPVLVSCTF